MPAPVYFFGRLNFVCSRHLERIDTETTEDFSDVTSCEAVVDVREDGRVFRNNVVFNVPLPGVDEFRTAGFENLSGTRSNGNDADIARILVPNVLGSPGLT